MRLSNKEKKIIKEQVDKIFGISKVMLFGSRINNNKKGGDIDLFILPIERSNLFEKKILLKSILEDILYKPVDIVIAKDKNRLIEKEAYKGVEL